jgi:hypothetical protein
MQPNPRRYTDQEIIVWEERCGSLRRLRHCPASQFRNFLNEEIVINAGFLERGRDAVSDRQGRYLRDVLKNNWKILLWCAASRREKKCSRFYRGPPVSRRLEVVLHAPGATKILTTKVWSDDDRIGRMMPPD